MFQENFANKVSTEKKRLERLRERLESELSDTVRRIGAAERLMEMGEEITSSLNTLFGPPPAQAADPVEMGRSPEPDVADDPQPAPEPEPEVEKAPEPGQDDKPDPESKWSRSFNDLHEDQDLGRITPPKPKDSPTPPPATASIPKRDYPAKRGRPPKAKPQEDPSSLAPAKIDGRRRATAHISVDSVRVRELGGATGMSYDSALLLLCLKEMVKSGLNFVAYDMVQWQVITGINSPDRIRHARASLDRDGYVKFMGEDGFTVPEVNPLPTNGYQTIDQASKEAVVLGMIVRAQTDSQSACFEIEAWAKKLGINVVSLNVILRRLNDKGYVWRGEGDLKGHIFLRAREA